MIAQQVLKLKCANLKINCSSSRGLFIYFSPFKQPNNRVKFGGTEIWIWWQEWSEISFLRVATINLVSARNGKVGRIYFLIVMLVYGTVSREGSIFSWLWLSPARAPHLTGHMGASHWHMGAAGLRGREWEQWCTATELEQSCWSWLVGGTHRHGGRRGTVTRPGIRKAATCSRRRASSLGGGESSLGGEPAH